MKHIIHQIATNLIEEITRKVFSEKIHDLDSLTSEIVVECKAAAKELVEEFVGQMNRDIRDAKEYRKEEGLLLKEKERHRVLYTELGNIDVRRDCYYDKGNQTYVYPMDCILGIQKYARVGATVSAKLVNLAADVSYAKAADIVSSGDLSRQTVKNHILKLQVPEVEVTEQKTVKELHIYADEDHAHMQKANKERGKQNQIVPLVTVTEGTVSVGKRRNKTVGTVHFVDEKFRGKRLWKSVEGYVAKAYSEDAIERIYIHGDGGNWIKNGLENFTQTVHVMDGYHYSKAVKKLAKAYPDRNVRVCIDNALERNEPKSLDGFFLSLMEEEEHRETVRDFREYLLNNWEAIRNLKTLSIPGSCTEGQVSHVLSERFSRDPLGWSKAGLGKLSAIRVSKANGRAIKTSDFKDRTRKESYYEYADRYIQEQVEGKFDWSVFEEAAVPFDGTSGTQWIINTLGRNHGVMN